jgi:hypothetical protein
MSSNIVYPDSLLKKCQEMYEQGGIKCEWQAPTKEVPVNSLMIFFGGLGERELSVIVNLCFIPGLDVAAEQGIHILQTFVTIKEKVSSSVFDELLKATAKINTQVPLGAFGLFEELGLLYFKHSSLINSTTDDQTNISNIDKQNGLILYLQDIFMDALIEVAEGRMTVEQALQSTPLL